MNNGYGNYGWNQSGQDNRANYGAPYVTNAVAYAPADIRAQFIQRVYGLFLASVIVTVAAGAIAVQPAILPIVLSLQLLLVIGLIVCIIALMFARATPVLNTFLLYLFSGIMGLILGPTVMLVNRVAPGVPAQAAVLTVAVFGGLSAYVFISGKDFSYLGGMLWAGLIGLIVTGLLMALLGAFGSALYMLYCFAGVLIFSGYVLYDTSIIIRKLGPDDAVIGAINLYLDLINLFLYILRILMEISRRS